MAANHPPTKPSSSLLAPPAADGSRRYMYSSSPSSLPPPPLHVPPPPPTLPVHVLPSLLGRRNHGILRPSAIAPARVPRREVTKRTPTKRTPATEREVLRTRFLHFSVQSAHKIRKPSTTTTQQHPNQHPHNNMPSAQASFGLRQARRGGAHRRNPYAARGNQFPIVSARAQRAVERSRSIARMT
mmetsp:Transcript_30109/g.61126  ORF Transcript_30109/g.61126 Transcript_30109/m.61126 type:complete len:185 (+) Transcript_30109:417-971(+)